LANSGDYTVWGYVKSILSGERANPNSAVTVSETKAAKQRSLEGEAKLHGIDPTIWLTANHKHCNQCSRDDWPNGRDEVVYAGRGGLISRKPK
jgi:hypothetical protein